MNNLQVFNYNNNQVRTVVKNGEPWFVTKDVCDILGLKNPRQVIKVLDNDEKMTVQNLDSHLGKRGGAQFMNIISEFGVYRLMMRSNKKEAKAFQRWLAHDVLPDIRRHGMYMTGKIAEIAASDRESQ